MKNNSFITQLIFLCLFFSQNTLAMLSRVGQGVRGLGREIPKSLPKTTPVVFQPQRTQLSPGGFGANQGVAGGQRGLQVPAGKATESLLKPGRIVTLPPTGPTFVEVDLAEKNIFEQKKLLQSKDADFFDTIKEGITLGPISNKAVEELIKHLPEAQELFEKDSIIIRDVKDGSLLFLADKSDSGLGWNIQLKSSDAKPTLRAIYGTGEKADIYDRLGENFPSEKAGIVILKTSSALIKDVINLFKPILEHTPSALAKKLAALQVQQDKLLKQQAQAQLKAEQEVKELAELDELVKETMEGVEQEVNQAIEKQEIEKSQDEQKALQEYYEQEIAQLKETRAREGQEQEVIDLAQLQSQTEQSDKRLAEFKEQQTKNLSKTEAERKAELAEFVEKEEQQLSAKKQELAQARQLAEQQRSMELAQKEAEIDQLKVEQQALENLNTQQAQARELAQQERAAQLEQENKKIQQQEQELLESKQQQEKLKNERREQLKDQKIIEYQQAQKQNAIDLAELDFQVEQSEKRLAELKEQQTKVITQSNTEREAELAEFIKNEKLAFEIKQQEEIARKKVEQANFLGSITKGPQAQLADVPEKQIIDTQLQRQVAEELPLDQPRKQIISSKDPQAQLADVPEKQIIDTQLQKQVAEELPLDQPRKQIISSKDPQAQLANVPEKQIIDTQLQRQVAEELPLEQPQPVIKLNISAGGTKEKQPELLVPSEQKQPQDFTLEKKIPSEEAELQIQNEKKEELGSGDADDREEKTGEKENLQQDELLTDAEKENIIIPSVFLPPIEKTISPQVISSDVTPEEKKIITDPQVHKSRITTSPSRVSPVIPSYTPIYARPIQHIQVPGKSAVSVDGKLGSFGQTSNHPGMNVDNYRNNYDGKERKPLQENKNREVNNRRTSSSSFYQPETNTSVPQQIFSGELSQPSTQESSTALIPFAEPTRAVQPYVEPVRAVTPYQEPPLITQPEEESEAVMNYTETPIKKKPLVEKPQSQPTEESLNWFVRLLEWIKSLFLKITSPIRVLFGT